MQISRQVRSSALFLMVLVLGFFAVLPMSQAINLGEEAKAPEVVQVKIWDKPDGTAHKCTGTAISERWILTAGHCLEGESILIPMCPPTW
ncbi:trypsin-like serine protease [Arcanobacterium bovis]|uniref:Trypsin-like serine protease n=1 Tax=Arcanobacterium bovis TaxID=2529275 RepID=A0A4Q9V3U0_9ACTO|nr:trypsin-like serine protease [Arcanobacterium bovis]TBW23792.1 trypsin-like serine protease [Arcanobacterium bovis]